MSPASAGSVVLTVLTGVGAALGAPAAVWIVLGVLALALAVVAIANHPQVQQRIPVAGRLPLVVDYEGARRVPSRVQAHLASLYREGDNLAEDCRVVPRGSGADKALWHIVGGSPEAQIEREEQARGWDQRVSERLWAEADAFAPGWQAVAEPPPRATFHPEQSHTNPKGLADYYETKLKYLAWVLERLNR